MVSCRVRDWKWAGQDRVGRDRTGAGQVVRCGAVYGVPTHECSAVQYEYVSGRGRRWSGRGTSVNTSLSRHRVRTF
jgi:hypothetical protein